MPSFDGRTLDRLGYDGWGAGEINPEGATRDGLNWCR
jgi:hydroxypyruvate isomerase